MGNLNNGATNYNATIASTSTLASLLQNVAIYQVFGTSMTVNWTAFVSTGPGANTGEGYELDASTAADFTGQIYMSSNTTPTTSTQTVSGLTPFTTYYLRAGAYNYNNIANFVSASSAATVSVPPGPPRITAVYMSTIAVQWATVTPSSGYEVDASSTNFDGMGVIKSTVTTDGTRTTLVVDSMTSLSPNTTYFIRAGSLINGTTSYSTTKPSTSTLASLISPLIYRVNGTSIAVNWPVFAQGSGANTGEGYELDASTMASFVPLWTSSITTAVTLSTLTVQNLTSATTYYLRAGAINWNNAVNFVILSSTRTRGPDAVTNFSAVAQSNGDMNLTWSAPGDPYYNPLGAGSQYAIEWATYTVVWSTSNAGDTSSTNTWHVYIATNGVHPGDQQLYISTGLVGNITYHFRLWTMDPEGAWSSISNATSTTVTPVLSVMFGSSTYNFGSVNMGATTVSTSAITVTNGGNGPETYGLSVATSGPETVWGPGTSPPASFDTFLIYGTFNATPPPPSSFGVEDIVTSTMAASDATKFTVGGQAGFNIPSNAARIFWMRLDMPLTTSTTTQQQMNMTITASSP